MRGEAFNFSRLGTFLERADNTARILDVKYHILLPRVEDVGGALDYYQWTALLRSVSAFETYRTHLPRPDLPDQGGGAADPRRAACRARSPRASSRSTGARPRAGAERPAGEAARRASCRRGSCTATSRRSSRAACTSTSPISSTDINELGPAHPARLPGDPMKIRDRSRHALRLRRARCATARSTCGSCRPTSARQRVLEWTLETPAHAARAARRLRQHPARAHDRAAGRPRS